MLKLSLLGTYRVLLHDQPVTAFKTDKVRALLAYLAVEPRPHERSALAGLLWPGMPEPSALRNLTQTLVRLRQAIGDPSFQDESRASAEAAPPFLLLTRSAVQFNGASAIQVDVTQFTATAAGLRTGEVAQLETALALYQGELLAGFALPDSEAFDEWLLLKREYLHQLAVDVAHALTGACLTDHDYAKAQQYARRQLELDPWRESAHRQLMESLARSSQRNAALAQYETCRRVLLIELGVAPEAETTALYEQIRGGEVGSRGERGGAPPLLPSTLSLPTPLHNLPAQVTALIGREEEQQAVVNLLLDPNHRLVTLIGLGGVGKTRLALAVAQTIAEFGMRQAERGVVAGQSIPHFTDGVWFVPCAAVSAQDDGPPVELVNVLVQTLGIPQTGGDAQTFLLDSLRSKQLLLILDNLEHLLSRVELIELLLEKAPGVKVLATSRERLHLHAEALVPLDGLPTPAVAHDADAHLYASVRLFVERAKRTWRHFALNAENRSAVVRICQLVEGLPLGIELAAHWVQHFTPSEIAAALAHNLAQLADTARGRPDRHRTLQAAFDHSWQLLTVNERHILARAAILRGSFSRTAALAITGAKLTDLATLVDKSLLRLPRAGRYDMHELLRQFALHQLSLLEDGESAAVHARHSDFYLTLAGELGAALCGQTPHLALSILQAELVHIRQAYQWAVDQAQFATLARHFSAWATLFEALRLEHEGEKLMEQLTRQLQATGQPGSAPPHLLGRVLAERGRLLVLQGRLDEAGVLGQEAIAQGQISADIDSEAAGMMVWGYTRFLAGDYPAARQLLRQSLALARTVPYVHAPTPKRGMAFLQAMLTNCLAMIEIGQHQFATAAAYAAESDQLYQAAGDWWGASRAHWWLANAYDRVGFYSRAMECYRQTLRAAQEVDSSQYASDCLVRLGRIQLCLGDLHAAQEHAEQALAQSQTQGLRLVEGEAHVLLSQVLFVSGQFERAWLQSQQALQLAQESGFLRLQAQSLASQGQILAARGRLAEAKAAYLGSLALYRQVGAEQLAIAMQAQLAQLALQEGTPREAQTYVEQILGYLQMHSLEGVDDPLQVYVICYQVLTKQADERAGQVLIKARYLLHQQALLIDDHDQRRSFLARFAPYLAPLGEGSEAGA